MIQNKKGLSDIVITLIIIVLSLVAIGGVWAVVRNVIGTNTQNADLSARCMNANIQAVRVACGTAALASTNAGCNVTLSRMGQGTEKIDGVKFVFKGYVTATPTTKLSSPAPINGPGNVPPLVQRVMNATDVLAYDTGITFASNTLNQVELTPYVKDAAGNEYLCGTSTFAF